MTKLSDNAMMVLKTRSYLKKDSRGKLLENAEQMFKRVARAVAEASGMYGERVRKDMNSFYEMMNNLEFLPNSPTLMHAGKNGPSQLSACFVLPISDSLESLFKTLHDAAMVLRTGGGVGYAFSNLRPRGDRITVTGGESSGPVSFMELFDHMAKVINEGSSRRAAMMGILRVDHPDILEFIGAKEDGTKLTNFNVSVGITDEFMEALERNEKYALRSPQNNKVVKKVKARDVFNLICEKAWKIADPGLVFLDRMNAACPIQHLGEIEATNPCGEQPLLPYQSCNLGSVNLGRFVKKVSGNGNRNSRVESMIDWKRLEEVVRLGVKFLDNVIDVSAFPLPAIKEMAQKTRKIGLGVMGWADMLFQLNIAYDSEEAVVLAEKVAKFLQDTARDESVKLGESRGSFPGFRGSWWHKQGYKAMRNSTVNTIAPTGTISIIANCSSGIEPIFALSFKRKNILEIGKTELIETNEYFEKALKKEIKDIKKRKQALKEVVASGSLGKAKYVSKKLKRVFVTSHEVSVDYHIRMQAAWQRYIDSAVSKTINLPHDATIKDVEKAYLMAYQTGCKGVTVYRDGCREEQVLNRGQGKKSKKQEVKGESEEICSECGAEMMLVEGCATCPSCGNSKCSV